MGAGNDERGYIPAAGRDWLLPLYDLQRFLGERSIKRPLVEQAGVRPGQRVLDIGCGTGTLAILLKQVYPGVEVVGLDPDPKALAIARRKAAKAAVALELERGFSDELPYPDGSFDRVLSSFMFHHLTRAEKLATLAEIRRVLRPGGSLHLLDFGPPRGRLSAWIGRLLHHGQHTRDNLEGRIPSMMGDSGLEQPEEIAHRATLFGSVSYYRAVRTAAPSKAAGAP
jgi:ubiquinone/menaquinone biosynthesis C-methylase UbiE